MYRTRTFDHELYHENLGFIFWYLGRESKNGSLVVTTWTDTPASYIYIPSTTSKVQTWWLYFKSFWCSFQWVLLYPFSLEWAILWSPCLSCLYAFLWQISQLLLMKFFIYIVNVCTCIRFWYDNLFVLSKFPSCFTAYIYHDIPPLKKRGYKCM